MVDFRIAEFLEEFVKRVFYCHMRKEIKNAKRIIVKVGTSTLIYPNGNINLAAIDQLAFVLSDLRNRGKEAKAN